MASTFSADSFPATTREIVAGLTPNSRAISAAVLRPESTACATSERCFSSRLGGRPPHRRWLPGACRRRRGLLDQLEKLLISRMSADGIEIGIVLEPLMFAREVAGTIIVSLVAAAVAMLLPGAETGRPHRRGGRHAPI